MNFQLFLQLLLHTSLTSAIPALNGVLGKFVMGPEALVTDFAVFNDDEVGDLIIIIIIIIIITIITIITIIMITSFPSILLGFSV